jgi:hypothetical protein
MVLASIAAVSTVTVVLIFIAAGPPDGPDMADTIQSISGAPSFFCWGVRWLLSMYRR